MSTVHRQILIFAISIFGFVGCGKKVSTPIVVNQVETTPAPIQLDTLFTGGGNEPGWRVLIFKTGSGELLFDLLMDYGERHFSGSVDTLSNLDPKMAIHYMLYTSTKPLILSIAESPCTDDADIQYENSVTLSDQNFVLTGCGRFSISE
jgi:uncharacterized membrane protein